jgi:hypothetical protein
MVKLFTMRWPIDTIRLANASTEAAEGFARPADAEEVDILYHFDQVFTILKILVSEKADKFSFELRRILKRSVFSAVTRD